MNNDKRIFACTALLVFIAGLLVPFVVGAMGHEELALGFLTVAEFLALLFGILSWRDRIGRVVIITQLALVVLSAGAFFLVLQPRQQRRLAEMERQSAEWSAEFESAAIERRLPTDIHDFKR